MSYKHIQQLYQNRVDIKDDPEYNLVDLFMLIDVKSDKTVNQAEMLEFISFLNTVKPHRNQVSVTPTKFDDLESGNQQYFSKVKELDRYVADPDNKYLNMVSRLDTLNTLKWGCLVL